MRGLTGTHACHAASQVATKRQPRLFLILPKTHRMVVSHAENTVIFQLEGDGHVDIGLLF